MRGRNIFNMVYPIILIISKILLIFPKFILAWIWTLSDLFPGLIGVGIRYILALRLAKKIGKNVFFGKNIEIKHWEKIELGNNVSIHKNSYIDAIGHLKIANDVSIAHNSSILTFEHTWEDKNIPIRSNKLLLKPIVIENDVWIGCGCRILAGVTIKSRSIIAAGAVVVNDVDKNTIVGGVPAKIIKRI